jgi:hypothetical protein
MSNDGHIKDGVLKQSGNSGVSAEVDTTDMLMLDSDATTSRQTVALNEGATEEKNTPSQVGPDTTRNGSCSASAPGDRPNYMSSNDEIDSSDSMEKEVKRMKVLQSYRILDTNYDDRFDSITSIASRIFKVPVSIVSLVDSGRYVLYFSGTLAQFSEANFALHCLCR